jgi:hypothetical protein
MTDPVTPLTLTTSPSLDAALMGGWDPWLAAARKAGAAKTAAWIARRLGEPDAAAELAEAVEGLLGDDTELRAGSASDLAESVEAADEILADTLWEGCLGAGMELADPDIIFEAVSQLAGIAEEQGEAVVAAEYWIHFLNWRREEQHPSDPESVQAAFDEIIRLAEEDGEQKLVADWTYRQVRYTKLVDAEDERAVAGDWEAVAEPYSGWA